MRLTSRRAMTMDETAKRRARRFILLTVFIYSIGFGIIMPALPDLIRELADVDLADATRIGAWIGAAYAIFQFLMGPLAGNLSDRFGRRPIFLFSLAAFGTDFLLMGLAPSVAWLFVGRAIAGGLGAVFGPANAAMADMSAPEERAASFGKVGAAFGFGFIMGPAIGGFLADFGTRIPFFVAAGLAFANCVYGYFVFPETLPADKRRAFEPARANPFGALGNFRKIKGVLPFVLVYFLWTCAINVYPSSWSFFAPAQYGWDSKMVGLSLTAVGISMVVFQSVVIGRVVARFGELRTAILGMATGIAASLLYAFIGNGTIAFALTLLNGVSGMAMPSVNALMSRATPPQQQGELQGLNGSLAALALLLSQLSYNNALAHFTQPDAPFRFAGAPFIIAAAMGLCALLALLLLARRRVHDS